MMDSRAPETNLLRISDVVTRLRVSKATIYRLVNQGAFPKPFLLGSSSVWDEGEINAHIQKLKAAR
jgi:predicted DNA-binding transcriptional regulator AlpA